MNAIELVDSLADRLPAESLSITRSIASGGEYGVLLEELLPYLTENHISVTAEERKTLHFLVTQTGVGADQLSRL